MASRGSQTIKIDLYVYKLYNDVLVFRNFEILLLKIERYPYLMEKSWRKRTIETRTYAYEAKEIKDKLIRHVVVSLHGITHA